jgi:large subunit ribosomal protein L2
MRYLKPTNNAQRNAVRPDYSNLTPKVKRKGRPRKLFEWLPTHAGRNNQGTITAKHRKGGHKKIYRKVNSKSYIYENAGEGTIESIEYDPYRTGFISFISWRNGAQSFIITPQGLKVGDKINTKDIFQVGNSFPLSDIPNGTLIYNLELRPKGGSKLIRAAGNYGTVMGESKRGWVLVKLPSKEVREFLPTCWATIGKVSNPENKFVRWGKAGVKSWKGRRPKVRIAAMNAVDGGGGEGKKGKGKPNKKMGKKTRKANKPSNKFIILSRHQVKARSRR